MKNKECSRMSDSDVREGERGNKLRSTRVLSEAADADQCGKQSLRGAMTSTTTTKKGFEAISTNIS